MHLEWKLNFTIFSLVREQQINGNISANPRELQTCSLQWYRTQLDTHSGDFLHSWSIEFEFSIKEIIIVVFMDVFNGSKYDFVWR